jgi:hypothetical protein
MDAQLTTTEINDYREILQGDGSAQKALDSLEKYNGRFYDSFDELLREASGQPQDYDLERLRKVTLKQLREEVCGDDSFRTKLQEYSKNPGSTPLLTGLIVSLVGLAAAHGLPLDPAIATIVVLYILKIGLNIFCQYSEESAKPPADDPESRRIPHD